MSLLGNQTNISQKDYFFLLANVSTLKANSIEALSISTGSLTANTGLFQTFSASTINTLYLSTNYIQAESISSQNTETNYLEVSTALILAGAVSSLVTNNVVLDGNTLDTGGAGFGAVLLLNGLPIATGTSSLSSIQDWSFFPALSTLQMGSNDIKDAGNITCQNIYNALNIQTDTLAAMTGITAPSAVFTNLRNTNLSTVNLVGSNASIGTGNFQTLNGTQISSASASISSIAANRISTGQIAGGVGVFGGISSLGVSTGFINGTPFISGSNWSQYPAVQTVNLSTYGLSNSSNLSVVAARNITMSNPSGGLVNWNTSINTGDFTVLADQGLDATNTANLNLTAQGGTRGVVAITANAGVATSLFGQIDLTANGGSVGGIGTGGLVNITANTPLGFCNATSAIKLSAAGINSYAGAIPSFGSGAGYNFIHGDLGVNITSGLASLLPNAAGTTYIYGTAGVEIPSQAYMSGIEPYWDSITTPPDLTITGRYILPNFAQVCVRLSNVKYINFQEDVGTAMSNCDVIAMSSNGSITTSNLGATVGTVATLSNTNLIGTGGISGYATVATTGLTATTLNGLPVSAYLNQSTFQTASISSLTVSSINGVAYSPGGGAGPTTNKFSTLFTSTLAFSTMTSVGSNTAFNYPIFIDYDTAGNATTAGVAMAIQNHNFGTGAVINRLEMGARANGENYIMSVWPGQNLEDLVIDATQVNIRDSDGFSTIINENPFGVRTNGVIQAPIVSSFSETVSSINNFVAFGSKSIRVQGDVSQIQLSNNNIAGLGTNLNLLSRVAYSEIQSFNSNFTTPLPLVLTASYTSTASMLVSTINGERFPYPYGSFSASTSQTLGVAGTSLSTILNTTEASVGGVSIVGGVGTRVAVSTSGTYRFLASPQFDTTTGGQQTVNFWFQKNGTPVPRSASRMTIQNNGEVFSSVEIMLPMNAQDYIETCFTSTDTNMNLAAYPASGAVPAVPSLIFNAQKIGE